MTEKRKDESQTSGVIDETFEGMKQREWEERGADAEEQEEKTAS